MQMVGKALKRYLFTQRRSRYLWSNKVSLPHIRVCLVQDFIITSLLFRPHYWPTVTRVCGNDAHQRGQKQDQHWLFCIPLSAILSLFAALNIVAYYSLDLQDSGALNFALRFRDLACTRSQQKYTWGLWQWPTFYTWRSEIAHQPGDWGLELLIWRRVFDYAQWRKDWVKVSWELAQDRGVPQSETWSVLLAMSAQHSTSEFPHMY